MRILVTGGAGFVGSHLVDALLEAGHHVRVLDSLEAQVHGTGAGRPAHVAPGAELQVGDVRDRQAVEAALDGIEAVFHLAAVVGVGQSMYEIERYVSANSLGSAVLLEELVRRRHSIRKLIVASSMSTYGEGAYRSQDGALAYPMLRPEPQLAARRWELEGHDGRPLEPVATPESKPLAPTSVYAVTKRSQEEMFLTVGDTYRIPTVALRYFNIYGPRQALSNPYTGVVAIFSARLLNHDRPLIFEDGRQTRDFVHVSDVVRANLLALGKDEANGRVYNVGTGRPTSILQVAGLLAEELDVQGEVELTGRFRAGDIRHCYADISRIERELGFRAKVSLERGIRELLAWLRGQNPDDRVEEAVRELASRGLAR
jgi:dTDP-L-rhamnose 4-epimerase